ncbi:MAG TPA: DUF4352 domain-containing protein [Ktedonobacterales bacterium]|nr:DUF4352 domain-containing protein [Ktedonobacterales bacterium]
MSVFDLLFLASLAGGAAALTSAVMVAASGRWAAARAILLALVGYALLYTLAIVAVAEFTPQRTIPMGQPQCFGDWCTAVASASQTGALTAGGQTVAAQGRFLVVTLRVTSTAKRVSQREQISDVYLLDHAGRRYEISVPGQNALIDAGQSGQLLDTLIDPGASFTHTVVFDTPADDTGFAIVIAHDTFPDIAIIGDDQSLFHRPTLMRVDATSARRSQPT